MAAAQHSEQSTTTHMTRTRWATSFVMAFERLWPRLLPVLLVAALFTSLAWFGVFRLVPDALRIGLSMVLGLAAMAALWPLGGFRWPSAPAIDRRIERANALIHEPVTVQSDKPSASGDPFAMALWREHQKRMRDKLENLHSGLPRTGVPARDPYAVRTIVPLLLATAFAFSFGPLGGRLSDPFHNHARLADAVPMRVDAWVTPPSYTGRPPVFLTSDGNRNQTAYTVPEGSVATIRLSGAQAIEQPVYVQTKSGAEVAIAEKIPDDTETAAAAKIVHDFEFPLTEDGTLTIPGTDQNPQGWTFTILADTPPRIALEGEIERAVNGTLSFGYMIEDDYGAVSAKAEFAPKWSWPDARPLFGQPDMNLSLPRRRADPPLAKTSTQLAEHPWAGLPVAMTLQATDAAGQEGRSPASDLRLPERPFTNQVAKAIIELRRYLALDANQADAITELLGSIMLRPEDTFDKASYQLGLETIRARIDQSRDDDGLRAAIDYMWEVAIGIEEGDLTDAERRLRQAQEALKNAIENGASEQEIEQLMAELREALQDFLREFAERQMQNGNQAQQQNQQSQELRQSDLDRMLDQLEQMAKSGSKDRAQQMLSELQNMLDNLQMGQQNQRQAGDQSEMRQQMDKLGELMRRQQELMNETFRMDQMQRNRQQQRQGQQQDGEGGEQAQRQPGDQGENGQEPGQGMSDQELADILKQLEEAQRGLQQQLGELQKGLEGLGMEPSDDFADAGESMGRAGDRLGDGDGESATGEQGDALDALRRGAQNMMQQMQQAMQGQQGGSEEDGQGQAQMPNDIDPLGRPRATTGPDFGDTVKVPDEIDVQRARQILEAIRKRLGDALSPKLEKDYLERLLDLQ
jgi:uncharacterized protein (TIGR02302 family)